MRIYGSRETGAAKPDNDLDLLVRFAEPVGLFEVIGSKQEIESQLKLKVDVVQGPNLDPPTSNLATKT